MYIYRLFSPWLRICHWVWTACIAVLFATGLYIGSPMFIGTQGIEPAAAIGQLFSMETIRRIHFWAAFVFIGCLLLRFYLFFINPADRLFPRFWSRQYLRGTLEMIAYYGMIRPRHPVYLRNPLAATSYALVYVLMVAEAATGLAMYAMIRPNSWLAGVFGPVNNWLGNEYVTHFVHHVIGWVFALFVLVHVYMVFFNDIKEKNGELSSMVSGRKFLDEAPVDAKSLE